MSDYSESIIVDLAVESLQRDLDAIYGIRYMVAADYATPTGVDILDIDGNHLEFFASVSDARKHLVVK
jgi:hypothetical protein